MTPEAWEPGQSDRGEASTPSRVIVVGIDAARLSQYRAALSTAQLPFRTMADPAEAQALIAAEPPEVLVLDLGLPRLAMLQLYGAARSAEGSEPVQVLFVGQDSDTGPDDHYLPGEPSPVMAASWVSDLLAGPEEPPVLDMGVEPALPSDERVAASHDDARPDLVDADVATAPAPSAVNVEGSADVAADAAAANAEAGVAPSDVPETVTEKAQEAPVHTLPAPGSPAVEPAPAVAAPGPAAEDGPASAPSRRSYLTLVRIGLVLFILGLLLFLVRLEWTGPAVTPPPTVAPPATPAGLHLATPPVAFGASVSAA